MRSAPALSLAVFLSLTIFGLAQDSTHPNSARVEEGQILALENAWNQAELQHDPAALKLILADDFVITEPDGTIQNRQQHFDFMKDKSYHYDLLVSEDFRIKVYGDAGIVTGTYHEKAKYKGKQFDRRGRFTDTWVKSNGSWRCVASHDSLPARD
jgi:ketosteroid isomerase-like protein